MADLNDLNSKSFAGQLHTIFKVQTGASEPVALELAELNESPTPPHLECFSLVFRGPVAPRLPQQTHRFEHEALGTLDLFVTTIGADAAGTSYEVIVHRIRPKQP